jgi:hypothetical protein
MATLRRRRLTPPWDGRRGPSLPPPTSEGSAPSLTCADYVVVRRLIIICQPVDGAALFDVVGNVWG